MSRDPLKRLTAERRKLSDLFMKEESDRAAAIIEATVLDDQLKLVILRIPTKPAMHSNMKPATCSDLKPAGVPI